MAEENRNVIARGTKLVLHEFKDNPFRKFHIAFSLMSIIPFLTFFYLLITRLFTINILIGDIGMILFISIAISLCGFYVGYNIIKNTLKRLVIYAAQAKHSDELKSTFVATVSHELRSPLTTIKASLSTIMEGIAGQINDTQKKIVHMCQGVIDRMHRLINSFLDLHKIEAGMLGFNRKFCSVGEIVERQISEFDIAANQKKIKVLKDISNRDISLWGDEDKIAQVVNNLMSNAVKYTLEGGTITVKVTPSEGFVKLEVTDTGPGIPSDKLVKIFDKFERLDMTKEGTGLGLAIAKDMVELHKGKIWAESKFGEGSKFIVILPQDLRSKKRREELSPKKRILVVDDEVDLTGLIKMRLEANGYEVITAYDGKTALEKAEKENPDLVVLDIMLPEMSGYDVCRKLKIGENTKSMPVIMLTARFQPSDIRFGEEMGADAYMTKPFEPSALIRKIRELVK